MEGSKSSGGPAERLDGKGGIDGKYTGPWQVTLYIEMERSQMLLLSHEGTGRGRIKDKEYRIQFYRNASLLAMQQELENETMYPSQPSSAHEWFLFTF